MVKNNDIKKIVELFRQKNGNQNFTLKELIIYFNTEQMKRWECLDKELNRRIEKSNEMLAEHDKVMQHILDELPKKGFCDDMNVVLNEWNKDKVSLGDKVDTLWYDRKLMKGLLIAVLGALITNLFYLFIHL